MSNKELQINQESNLQQDHFPTPSSLPNLPPPQPSILLQKLKTYQSLDSQQRLVLVKGIRVGLDLIGQQVIMVLPNLLDAIIKQQAGKQLGQITHLLQQEDRGAYVLKHVIQMAHDDTDQDNRVVAVQLFSAMSDCFGSQLCQQYIGLQILSLGDDSSVKVRKQAIKHLPNISKLVSKQFFTNRFSTFFIQKAKDSSNWAIRKTCVDIIIQMSILSSQNDRQNKMSQIMLTLLKDSNKWVRLSAYKNLGKFIHTLKGLKINQKLLQQYYRMPDNDINSIGRQNQIIQACAFCFPAVVDAVGKNNWQQLNKVYQKLLKSSNKKIKITLSQSLHQISKIIGQQNTEKYLFKVIDLFFKQKNDQIKLGITKHLIDILQHLSPSKRDSLITVFQQLTKDAKKWRIRSCISSQLGRLLNIYQAHAIFEYIVPLLLKFCNDTVSIVRQQASTKVANFISKLSTVQGLQVGLIQSVKAFGTSPKYTQRQSFLMMCENLMKYKELFQENFLQILIKMKEDKVLNVRLVLAQLIKKHYDNKGQLSQHQKFIQLYNELKQDQNQEISSVFNNQ